jgi:hypothetical protein
VGSRQRLEASPQPNGRLVLKFIVNRTEFNFHFNSFLRPQVSSDRVRVGGVRTKWTRCLAGSRCSRSRGEANAVSPVRAARHGGTTTGFAGLIAWSGSLIKLLG